MISESFAERIVSYAIIDLSIDVMVNGRVKWIAPIGTRVSSLDPVVTLQKTHSLDTVNQAIKDKLGDIFVADTELAATMSESSLTVPNNIEDAIVSDVLIQENKVLKIPSNVSKPDYGYAKTSAEVIEEYEKSKDRGPVYKEFPEYVASDTLRPVDLSDKSYRTVYTVRVRLIKIARPVVGEKITSRYGGKGVVSKILPDATMPVVEVGGKKLRAEVVMNPYSTINRKIPSVLMETGLGNCAVVLHSMVDDLRKTPEGRKKIMPLIEKYYPRYHGMSVTKFLELHNRQSLEDTYRFDVGSYSKITPATVQGYMTELGVPSEAVVEVPEADVTDWKELESVLTPDEIDSIRAKVAGKFVKTQKPLSYGYVYLERLYHQPQYSGKVVSDIEDVYRKGKQPIAGRGLYRKNGGQKIGEMEVWALLARNAKPFLQSARGEQDQEMQQRFLDHILGLGLMVTDKKGYGQGGSNLKASLQALRSKLANKNNR